MEFGYTATPWFRKTKNEIDVENLKNYYNTYFKALDECVEKEYLSKEQSEKIKKSLRKQYQAEKFLIPVVNDLGFRFEDMMSKGLERMFGKGRKY